MSEKTDTQYTGYYISGHPFNCFSTRGEEAIYAPSQKSNPTYLTCNSPCVMKNLDVELPNGTWVDSFSCSGLSIKRSMSELLSWFGGLNLRLQITGFLRTTCICSLLSRDQKKSTRFVI